MIIDPSGEALLGIIRDLSIKAGIQASIIAQQAIDIAARDTRIAELERSATVPNAAGTIWQM